MRYLIFNNDGIVHKYDLERIRVVELKDIIEMCSYNYYHNRRVKDGLSNEPIWKWSIEIKEGGE